MLSCVCSNGRWRSVWTCSFKQSGGNAELKGTLKINVHYYEDGNVQLNTNTSKTRQISGSVRYQFHCCVIVCERTKNEESNCVWFISVVNRRIDELMN
jgi:hypothetical protein